VVTVNTQKSVKKLKGKNLLITHHKEVQIHTVISCNLHDGIINPIATIKMNPAVIIMKSFRKDIVHDFSANGTSRL